MPSPAHPTHDAGFSAQFGQSMTLNAIIFDPRFDPGCDKGSPTIGNETMLSSVLPSQSCMTSATEHPLAAVDGWPVNIVNEAQAVNKIISAAACGDSFAAFTLNLDHLVKLRSSAVFRNAYMHARFVTADGAPVARLARRQDARIERTTGADLIVPLARAAAAQKMPVY